MSRTRKIGGAVAVLLVALLAGVLAVDAVARSALESALSRTFGTESTVESLDVGILAGRVTLEDVRIANPEGFGDSRFLSLRAGRLGAGLASLLRDTVEVRELTLEGVELDLEQRASGSNFGRILASVDEAREERGERDGTAYRIDELVIRDVTARLRLSAGPAGESEATVRVPEIRLEGVGSGSGGAVDLAELADLVLRAVLGGVARQSGGLPGSLRELLGGRSGTLPGGIELRLPGTEGGASLEERAEEGLRQLLPGQDDDG